MARKKEYQKPTFNFSVRINNGEPINFKDLSPERKVIIQKKLSDSIADPLGYVPADRD